MNELFVRIFLSELRKAGFTEAFYDKEQDWVVISPQYSRFYVALEDGEYLIHYNGESQPLMPKIQSIRDTAFMLTAAWEQSTPMPVGKFRKLLEWNGVVLAARDDGDRGLYYVTWRYDSGRQEAYGGFYTDNIADAMRDYIGRSGLYPRERLFTNAQIEGIRRALAYRLEHDGGLLPDTEKEIKSILLAIED